MGEYMENMASDQIDAGLHHMACEWASLKSDIENYITSMEYTWQFDSIIDAYLKKKDGFYISHTANDVVTKFCDRLDKFRLTED